MYQTVTANDENDFGQLFHVFLNSLSIDERILAKDESEWDMDATYVVNHACIWNNPESIDKTCKVVEKNDYIAVVLFNSFSNGDLIKRIFRLEDLTKKPNEEVHNT